MAVQWQNDPALPGFHPAGAWDLKHGRAFVPMLRDRPEAVEDFDYVVGMDAGYPDPGEPRSPLALYRVGALQTDGAAAAALQDMKDNRGMIDPRLHLMPLRRRMLGSVADDALPAIGDGVASGKVAGEKKPTALVGVIDHAINVVNARFRHGAARSRVAHAWYQGAASDGATALPFGREWSGAELSDLIAANNGDDDRILRAMGMLNRSQAGEDPLVFRQSHGTHVLDLAAGEDPGSAAAKFANILAVILPPGVVRESSGSILPLFFLQGFDYLLRRARAVSAAWGNGDQTAIPLYVNASLGVSGGPRGGQSLIETGVAALIAEHEALGGGPVTLVLPAGNRNLAEGHAWGNGDLRVTWRVQPGDRTSNHMDCRVTGAGSVTLTLTPPGGPGAAITLNDGDASVLTRDGAVIGRAVLAGSHLGVSLAPTDPMNSGRTPAPPGAWGVEVVAAVGSQIESWILRDDSPPGFSDGGRQSYFEDPDYIRHLPTGDARAEDQGPPAPVERDGALNAMATRAGQVVIGGASWRETERAGHTRSSHYSAGPMREDRALCGDEAVTVSAVSDRSRVQSGVLGATTRSGGSNAMNGTSVAAPQAVRLLAAETVPPANPAAFLHSKTVFGPAEDPDVSPPARSGAAARRSGEGSLPAGSRILRG